MTADQERVLLERLTELVAAQQAIVLSLAGIEHALVLRLEGKAEKDEWEQRSRERRGLA